MSKVSNISAICIGIFLSHVFSGIVFGGAFDNTGIGLQGMSMGNALTGIADDASAVHYNPAGLALHENHTWLAEAYSSITSSNVDLLACFIGAGYNITKSIAIGISLMCIYGFEDEYDSRKYNAGSPSLILGFRYENLLPMS
jgi:long-subunit fatty acid transport protein